MSEEIQNEPVQIDVPNADASTEPKRRSRFVTDVDVATVDLGDGDWVKIKKRVPFEYMKQFNEQLINGNNFERTAEMLSFLIIEWNLLLPDGTVAPINFDTLKMLEMESAGLILEALPKIEQVPKAEPSQSTEQSSGGDQTLPS